MNVNEVAQLIGSLGFPIVACAAVFWKSWKDEQMHREESKEWSEAIARNTAVMERLIGVVDSLTSIDVEKEVK